MSILLPFNGQTYIIPTPGEVGWGSNLDAFFVAIPAGCLQKTGGSFTLSAETDFGGAFGLKALYLKSRSTNPASTGIIRLANGDNISWRNNLNTLDLPLSVSTFDHLVFNGVDVALQASVTLTGNRAVYTGSTGLLEVGLTTSTELGYLNGVISPIQAQINTKAPLNNPSFTGQIRAADGAVTAPSITFQNETITGIYRPGANALAISLSGIKYAEFGLSAIYLKGQLTLDDGTAAAPSLTFVPDINTGLYRVSSEVIGFTVNGSNSGQLGLFSGVAQFQGRDGSATLPYWTFVNDPNTGLYSVSADVLGFSVNGSNAGQVGLFSGVTQFQGRSGTASVPYWSFVSDSATGMYLFSGSTLGFSTGGITAWTINSIGNLEGRTTESKIYPVDGTVSLPAFSFLNEANSGFYRIGTGDLGISCSGGKVAEFTTHGVAISGTDTNDSASSGYVGQYAESIVANVNFPATDAYGDLTSIALTAGDWDVVGIATQIINGATITYFDIGISTTSGNSGTGLIVGSNKCTSPGSRDTYADVTNSIPTYRVSVASTTTMYLKFRSGFTVATPKASGRISARRVR
jgi:hypothetical protein